MMQQVVTKKLLVSIKLCFRSKPGDKILFSATKFVTVDKVNPASLTGSQNSTIFDYAAQTVNVTPGAGSAAPSAGDYTGVTKTTC